MMNVVDASVRGAMNDHVLVRLADEGVPISAISRAVHRPFGEVLDVLREARDAGHILAIPASDWPAGTRRDCRVPTLAPIRMSDFEDALFALMEVYHLTRSEARILAALLRRPSQTKASLHAIVQQHDKSTEPKIVDVFVHKIRRKLAGTDIEITTIWGRGYLLTAASQEILRRAITEFERALNSEGEE